MTKLHLSSDFTLPVEAVTQTFAILAKRGVGKTYTASVMAEEMLKAHQSIIALDPTGAWWGLRSDFPVVIFGGEHGDLPLEESAGDVVARSIVDNRFPAVIDLSLFRKGQMIRFMTAFAETLYRLNREPLHLFVDEADAVAPQGRSYGGEENRMLGAMEDIVRRGRKRGIGCTLITQRPSVLNKNVLTQCEVLVAMRLVHPRDIDAVMEWVNVHGDPKLASEMRENLPSLDVGEAWFWSPGWGDFFRRAKIRRRETFDSSATPKPGDTIRKPKQMAKVDLDALGESIRQTAAQAKENDPKELRRQIAELKKQLAAKPEGTKIVEKVVEVPVLKNGQLNRTEGILSRLEKIGEKTLTEAAELRRLIAPSKTGLIPPAHRQPSPAHREIPQKPAAEVRLKNRPILESRPASQDRIPDGERRVLTAITQHQGGVTREQLTVLTGYKRSSRDTYLQRLRAKDFIQDGPTIVATSAGVEALGTDFEPLPTGPDLREYWLTRLPEGERKVLEVMIQHYPDSVDRESLDTATGYKRSSRDTYLQRLSARQLVSTPTRGTVRASDELF